MGGTITKDISQNILECYEHTFGNQSITRAQLPAFIDALITQAELPAHKNQYLAICDSTLISPQITKDAIMQLYESIKSTDLELEALKKQI